MGQFSARVSKFVQASDERMEACFKESMQRTIEAAQTPRAKGGNMPVDTAYLRNSGQAEIGQLPSGGSDPANAAETTLTLKNWKPGQVFYFGWTANYARAMERRYAFMRLAAMKWQRTVTAVAKEMIK